jgi:hypothetical protein
MLNTNRMTSESSSSAAPARRSAAKMGASESCTEARTVRNSVPSLDEANTDAGADSDARLVSVLCLCLPFPLPWPLVSAASFDLDFIFSLGCPFTALGVCSETRLIEDAISAGATGTERPMVLSFFRFLGAGSEGTDADEGVGAVVGAGCLDEDAVGVSPLAVLRFLAFVIGLGIEYAGARSMIAAMMCQAER